MNTRLLLLPTLCLGGAALLLAPARQSSAFSTIGGNLTKAQRDVRVFDSFADAQSNDNVTPTSQFPGYVGAELAIWKGIVEWGSRLHGNGTGDPQGGNLLGDGGANFDAFWAGNATAGGSTNQNIVSAQSTCGGTGTLAFTETPISDGWRIRFCDEWTWDDGPGTIGGRFDIQGVMAHEYGHALGLGHSSVGAATMAPSVNAGSTSIRSLAADDIAGVQFVYGAASATKPIITATVANVGAGTLTIYGSNFDATGNEIWFTSEVATTTAADPIVRVAGANSSGGGTTITVSIPAAAGPGDVMVSKAALGGANLSNAFPTDLVGTFGTPPVSVPSLALVTPSTIDALIPGLAQTITLSGTNLDLATAVLLDGAPIAPARYTLVNSTTITLDMPQAPTLGAHTLGVTDGVATSNLPVTIVAPALPKYEVGNGEPANVIDRDDGLTFVVSGIPGKTHRVVASSLNTPSVLPGIVTLGIGGNFAVLWQGLDLVIPASGWLSITIPTASLDDPGPGGFLVYSQTIELALPYPLEVSNVQSNLLVQ